MKITLRHLTLPAVFASVCIVGCARTNYAPVPTIDPQVKERLDAPVNCVTARRDIAYLEEHKASVAKQVVSGARAIIPFSAAAGVVTGDEQDRAEVATGMYNDRIDAKIAEITRRCVGYLNGV
jgi:hypothetical protein